MERFAKIETSTRQTFFIHAKRRKSVEKMTHQKKIGVTERPRSLNPRKVTAVAICPIIVHFTTRCMT